MEFTIWSRYTNPASTLKWWRIELDENVLQGESRKGGSIKSPHEWFTAETADSVEAMTLFKGMGVMNHDKSLYDRFADMSLFTNLKFLSIPLDAIAYVDILSIANQLEHLHITPPRALEFLAYYEKRKRPLIFEASLPRLRTFGVFTSPIVFKNFDVARYPALEWLSTSLELDKSGKALRLFDNVANFKGFALKVISDKNLLKKIRKDLVALELWGISTKGFDFTSLSEFKSLKYLSLRGSKSPIDCSILVGLPQLLELKLFSFKSLQNVEALLGLDDLEKIHIYPDNKSDLSEDFKQRMKTKFRNCSILGFDITEQG